MTTMPNKTPPLQCRGLYTLVTPWVAKTDVVYATVALRDYADLQAKNIDIVQAYYVPMGLGQAEYDADVAAGALLVTLMSDYDEVIYVPNTYIAAYPTQSEVAAHYVVLSVGLGTVLDSVDLTFLQQTIAADCSDVIGIEPTVTIHTAPLRQGLTPDQAQVLEQNRTAAVTNRTTDHAKLLVLQDQYNELQEVARDFENVLIANGWFQTQSGG